MNIPKNLKEMLRDQTGYRLVECYYLELSHGLMGFFPAIVRGTRKMVLSTEKQVVIDVWKMLTPRSSKLKQYAFYVNEGSNTAFWYSSNERDQERIEPCEILTRSEFEKLKVNPDAFMWAPGLIGKGVSLREFVESIEAAAAKVA